MNLPRLYRPVRGGWTSWEISVERLPEGTSRLRICCRRPDGYRQEFHSQVSVPAGEDASDPEVVYQAACLEARRRWQRQKDREGYLERPEDDPRWLWPSLKPLAFGDYQTYSGHIYWESAAVHPILRGQRCLIGPYRVESRSLPQPSGRDQSGEVRLSRYITSALKPFPAEAILDGELGKDPLHPGRTIYLAYDLVGAMAYASRYEDLATIASSWWSPFVRKAEAVKVRSEEEALGALAYLLSLGYPSAVLRHGNFGYRDQPSPATDALELPGFSRRWCRVVDYRKRDSDRRHRLVLICQLDRDWFVEVPESPVLANRHQWLLQRPEEAVHSWLLVGYWPGNSPKSPPRLPVALDARRTPRRSWRSRGGVLDPSRET